jgi:colanic acid/amylovoran biosynthesis glycosyltransferase
MFPFIKHPRDIEVVHCHFGDKGALAHLWKQWGVINSKLSVVFHAHEMAGLTESQGRRLYGALFQSDALLLPATQYWSDCLLRWGAKPERTIVHRMGVNCDHFRYEPKDMVPNEPIQLLSVCRLTEMKGMEYSIRAVAKLHDRYRNLRYTIAGGGPLGNQLQRLVDQLALRDCVTLVGPQPQDKVAALLTQAHIYLVPSVTDSSGCQEGLPVALMEALAAGVPSVGTRHAGIPELISDRVTGLLVEERDVEGLAHAIESLVTDWQLCRQLAAQGRAVVEREFNIRRLNERLDALFRTELAT